MNLHDYYIRYETLQEGTQNKAVEAAITLIRYYKEAPEVVAQKMNAPLELILEALAKA